MGGGGLSCDLAPPAGRQGQNGRKPQDPEPLENRLAPKFVSVRAKEKLSFSRNRLLSLPKKRLYLFTGLRKGKNSRKRKFQNRSLGRAGRSERRSRLESHPYPGHFQVVSKDLPESLDRIPLGPSDWPERLLSSRSAPSPCASSSSYLHAGKEKRRLQDSETHIPVCGTSPVAQGSSPPLPGSWQPRAHGA